MFRLLNLLGVKNKKVVAIIVFSFFALFIMIDVSSGNSTPKSADGYTISSYNVVLDVKEDNQVDVSENINVNWNSTNHHGIYKFTPQWLKYTDKNGKTIKRKSNIYFLRSTSDPYSVDMVNKKSRIKLGDANTYVSLGNRNYNIQYTYDMGKDPYKGFDEFIFHVYGDYWGTAIENPTIQVNMPKSIAGCKINFFTDKKRKENVNEYVDYSVEGNTLYAKFDQDKYMSKYNKKLETSLTVDIELPEGYFNGGSWNYGYGSFTVSMIIIVITLFTIFKWIKYGKDYPKVAQTVEFYPPENMSAAEIGYIYSKQTSKKLTISLIVQLASKGYIKIDEIKDKKKEIQITNLIPIPEKIASFEENLSKPEIEVKMLKQSDSNLTAAEQTMMKFLFHDSDTKILKSNFDKFNEVKDSLINKGYIQILRDNEVNEQTLEIEKQKYNDQVTEYENKVLKYNEALSKMPALSELETIVYNKLFESKNVIILSEHKTLYMAFDEVENLLDKNLKDAVQDSVSTKKMISSVILTLIVAILSYISYVFIEDLDPAWNILYKLNFVCILINFFFTIFMTRKTEYGEKITAQILGFRNFLVTAEKEKLEMLVSENPNYFYNILPYTYVLNVSKKWIKKFEKIPMPNLDMGNFDYSNDWAYYSLYDAVYHPSASISGSSSSCGGGCSSCGGGCSSCGGGGSW